MPAPKSPPANPEAEWFGFRRVNPAAKTGLVQNVFASVAGKYDVMNDLMSGGLHRLWKDRLARMMRPQPGQTILDIAGGTGDVALRCYRATAGAARVIICDLNPAMLQAGRAKMLDQGIVHGIEFINGNAETLPLPDRSVDTACIAFGLRNVTRIDAALQEAARVLKPGGKFYCLEFSPGVSPYLKPVYDRYCMAVLPRLGALVAGDRDAYAYLAESIRQFPAQAALAQRMARAGFDRVTWQNLTGGIAVIHRGGGCKAINQLYCKVHGLCLKRAVFSASRELPESVF